MFGSGTRLGMLPSNPLDPANRQILIISNEEMKDIIKIVDYLNESWPGFLMPCHFLTNFEIQTYYQNEPKFNCAYSRNNLPNTKGGAHVVNLDEYESIGSHWTILYVDGDNIIHFDSFGVEHLPKEMEKLAVTKIT